MKPNPVGIITGEAIIDRENEINSIWSALQNQSVVLISERRIGKSSVLRKMEENPKDGWIPVSYWVEGKSHPIDFVEGLYEELLKKDVLKNKFYKLTQLYKKYVDDEEIGSWKFPHIKENWKNLLKSIIEDIVNTNKKVLIMFDELPLMIFKFINSEDIGPNASKDFLDTLREIRNKYEATKQIAFIFCGSIGIHLVIKDLKRNHGYNADPINNMKIISVSSMDDKGANLLCEKLTEGEGFEVQDKDKIFNYISKKTDNLPFYIQHVFAYFYHHNITTISEEKIDEAINFLLNDPKDEGFFRHYLDRIKTYYDKNIVGAALLILDEACKKDDYWREEDIIEMVKKHKETEDELIKETLDLLWSDHYLIRKVEDLNRFYKFRYNILQNWWKVNRG